MVAHRLFLQNFDKATKNIYHSQVVCLLNSSNERKIIRRFPPPQIFGSIHRMWMIFILLAFSSRPISSARSVLPSWWSLRLSYRGWYRSWTWQTRSWQHIQSSRGNRYGTSTRIWFTASRRWLQIESRLNKFVVEFSTFYCSWRTAQSTTIKTLRVIAFVFDSHVLMKTIVKDQDRRTCLRRFVFSMTESRGILRKASLLWGRFPGFILDDVEIFIVIKDVFFSFRRLAFVR